MRVDIRDVLVAALTGADLPSAGGTPNHGAFKRLFLSLASNGQPRAKHDRELVTQEPESIEAKPSGPDRAAPAEAKIGADKPAHNGTEVTSPLKTSGEAMVIPESAHVDPPENTGSLSDSNEDLTEPSRGRHKTVSRSEALVWSAVAAPTAPGGQFVAKALRDTIASTSALTAPRQRVDPARRPLDRLTHSQVALSNPAIATENGSATGTPVAPEAGSPDRPTMLPQPRTGGKIGAAPPVSGVSEPPNAVPGASYRPAHAELKPPKFVQPEAADPTEAVATTIESGLSAPTETRAHSSAAQMQSRPTTLAEEPLGSDTRTAPEKVSTASTPILAPTSSAPEVAPPEARTASQSATGSNLDATTRHSTETEAKPTQAGRVGTLETPPAEMPHRESLDISLSKATNSPLDSRHVVWPSAPWARDSNGEANLRTPLRAAAPSTNTSTASTHNSPAMSPHFPMGQDATFKGTGAKRTLLEPPPGRQPSVARVPSGPVPDPLAFEELLPGKTHPITNAESSAPRPHSADDATLRVHQDAGAEPSALPHRQVSAIRPAAVMNDAYPTEPARIRVEPTVVAESQTLGQTVPSSTEIFRGAGLQRERSPADSSRVPAVAPAPRHRPEDASFQSIAHNHGDQKPARSTTAPYAAPIQYSRVAATQKGERPHVLIGNRATPGTATLDRADTSGRAQRPVAVPAGADIPSRMHKPTAPAEIAATAAVDLPAPGLDLGGARSKRSDAQETQPREVEGSRNQPRMASLATPAPVPIKAMPATMDDTALSASPDISEASTKAESTSSHLLADTAEVLTPKSTTSAPGDTAGIIAPLGATVSTQGKMPRPDMQPSDSEPEGMTGVEAPRAAPETGTTRPVDLAPATAHARAAQVVQQLTPAMKVFPNGIAEVTLSPHELGHVRLAMRIEGDLIVVHMTADRPDTLDLLQRHTGQLGAALRDAGFADVNFTFSHGGRQPPSTQSGQASGPADARTETGETTHSPHYTPQGSSDRLDLRL